jgi:hypothetical protein
LCAVLSLERSRAAVGKVGPGKSLFHLRNDPGRGKGIGPAMGKEDMGETGLFFSACTTFRKLLSGSPIPAQGQGWLVSPPQKAQAQSLDRRFQPLRLRLKLTSRKAKFAPGATAWVERQSVNDPFREEGRSDRSQSSSRNQYFSSHPEKLHLRFSETARAFPQFWRNLWIVSHLLKSALPYFASILIGCARKVFPRGHKGQFLPQIFQVHWVVWFAHHLLATSPQPTRC